MRTTWQPLNNETKRGDSIELSRFFVLGGQTMKTKREETINSWRDYGE